MNRRLAPFFLASCVFGADPEWPGFRGPASNPSSINSNLPEKWSKTANIEWSATLPGLGWSSPIIAGKSVFVTTVTSDGKAKQPQIGSNYSNDYIAELQKQGKFSITPGRFAARGSADLPVTYLDERRRAGFLAPQCSQGKFTP